ncbi:MAG: hypothetical protein AAFX99_17180 [Myxococcota bacterium]
MPGDDVPTELALFTRLSYFVELHRAFYASPDAPGAPGAYVIQERSRCEPGFPVVYDGLEGDYWRECTRNRDAAYHFDPNERDPVGFDFARWGCDATTGTCPTPPPPVEAISSEDDTVPEHGLCSVPLPEGSPWRGMNHHSQFKCILVDPSQQLDAPERRLKQRFIHPDELFDGQEGRYQFNTCRVDCPEGDPECAADCEGGTCATSSSPTQGPLANPYTPTISCHPTLQDGSIMGDEVALAAVRYDDSPSSFIRGCIDEWSPAPDPNALAAWRELCPGYLESPQSAVGQGNPGNFGKLICGCGEHYGGVGCRTGCPNPLRGGPPENDFSNCFDGYCPVLPESEGGGRRGVWMCGDFSVTGPAPMASPDLTAPGGLRLRGGISLDPVGAGPMCVEGNCALGPSIH